MSIPQANTGLARTRSLRVPGKSPLTAPQPSTSPHIPSTTSHVSLFLTNLRLLDLDQAPDWPDITPATFSSKDAGGGLKARIQCVEWALYHLFVLWDQEEARNKLKPFYPPLDQVQSINLRAALLRGLEQAKRNGVLGRDAVIRKTMLDECKGDRFEEVLAVFSSAVLKRLVAQRALNSGLEYRPTISEKIALENYGYTGDRTELNGLLLAHKASLRKALKDKLEARSKYQDFEDLVALKQRNLARRKEQIKAAAGSTPHTVPDTLKKHTRQIIKTNWTGNEQWAETLLHDDTGSRQGGLLTTEFDDVWSGVRAGRLTDLEDQSTGLLEQLDQRVRLQRSRVEKWESFRQKLFGDRQQKLADQERKAQDKAQGVDLGFTAHKDMQPVASADNLKSADGPSEYVQLLTSMQAELEATRNPRIADFFKSRGKQAKSQPSGHLAAPTFTADPISDLSEWEDEPDEEIKPVSRIAVAPNAKGLGRTNSQLVRNQSLKKPAIQQQSRQVSHVADEEAEEMVNDQHNKKAANANSSQKYLLHTTVKYDHKPLQGFHGGSSSESLSEQKVLLTSEQKMLSPALPEYFPVPRQEPDADLKQSPPRSISPTQAMADQILASMSNASPSPTKKPRHTLSLAERTRLTMTRTKSFEPDDEVDPSLLSPSVARSIRKSNSESISVSGGSSTGEEYEDLVARTRRSMAGFEAAKQRAQLQRRQSERKGRAAQRKDSYFPRVEEEETGDASVIEDLLEGNQNDMEAIFKSRPRMRTSPTPSPHKRWDDEEYDS